MTSIWRGDVAIVAVADDERRSEGAVLGAAALNTEHESHGALKKVKSVPPVVCSMVLVAVPRPVLELELKIYYYY